MGIGRSVRSTTIASVLQIPTTTTTPPIIPKKITKPQQSVRYKSPIGPVSCS